MEKEKIKLGNRISSSIHDRLEKESQDTGKSKTTIIEEALLLYLDNPEMDRISLTMVDNLNKEYGNTIKKLKIKLTEMDKNIQILMELQNSLLFHTAGDDIFNYVSSEKMRNPIMEQAKDYIDEKIRKSKQNADYTKDGKR